MLRFIAWRILQSLIVLWVVYSVTFLLLMTSPGDPFIGEKAPPEAVVKALAQRYGLEYLTIPKEQRQNMSAADHAYYIFRAYRLHLGYALKGEFGPTIQFPNFSVNDIIKSSSSQSPQPSARSPCSSRSGAAPSRAHGAVRKGRPADLILSIITLLGVSLPTFVVGALFMMLFVVYIPILPAAGWGSWQQILLPAFVLALYFLAYIARLSRASTIDVLSADFVRTARAKGLPASRVILHHAGANASLPILSYLGPAAANILVGSFVVEKIFAIPGLGTHFVNACLNKDIPLVLGTVMVYTVLVVLFNLLVDLAYAFIDPRISMR